MIHDLCQIGKDLVLEAALAGAFPNLIGAIHFRRVRRLLDPPHPWPAVQEPSVELPRGYPTFLLGVFDPRNLFRTEVKV